MTCDGIECEGKSPDSSKWIVCRGRVTVRLCPGCQKLASRAQGTRAGFRKRPIMLRDHIDYHLAPS